MKKISDLTEATSVALDDLLEIEAAAGSRRAKKVNVLALITETVTDANHTIDDREDSQVVLMSTGASDRTCALPDSSIDDVEAGDEFGLHKMDGGAGVAILSRQGTDTIDGETTINLPSQYNYARVRYLGSGLYTLVVIKATFDSGWVDISGSVIGSTNNVVHNLDVDMSALHIELSLEDDAGIFKPGTIAFDSAVASTAVRAVEIEPVDSDTVAIQFGANGVYHLDGSGNLVLMNNGDATANYRIVLSRILGVS